MKEKKDDDEEKGRSRHIRKGRKIEIEEESEREDKMGRRGGN